MSAIWLTIAALTATTVLLRAVGPVALGGRELPQGALRIVELFAPVLFAALIVTQVFATGRALALDERALGLAAAALTALVRAPMPVVLLAAAGTTALVRALG